MTVTAVLALFPFTATTAWIGVVVLVGVAFFSREAGLASWIAAVPLTPHVSAAHGIPLAYILGPAVMVGWVGSLAMSGKIPVRPILPALGMGTLLLCATVTANLLNAVSPLTEIPATALWSGLLVVFALAAHMRPNQVWHAVIAGLVCGWLVATQLALSEHVIGRRLAIAESVRRIATSAGLVFVLTGALVVAGDRWRDRRLVRWDWLLLSGLLVAFAGSAVTVALTGSRGVGIAAIAALVVAAWFQVAWSRKSTWRATVVGLGLIALSILAAAFADSELMDSRLASRFAILVDPDVTPFTASRSQLWADRFQGVGALEMLFGAGAGSFRISDGRYAHSAFVDVLYSRGALTLFGLTFFVGWILKATVSSKSVVGMAILTFSVVAHITHGHSTSLTLLIGFGLSLLAISRSRCTGLSAPR